MADPPVLLLPLRLETLVLPRGNEFDLLIRVYPDDVHIDTHEPGITPDEKTWATHFLGLTTDADRRDAWARLADRFGDHRAAWIVQEASQERPRERATSWTRAAQVAALPPNWIAYLYDRSGNQLLPSPFAGGPITSPMAAGPDPNLEPSGVPPVDVGMRWLVDFEIAVTAGMAMRVPITGAQKDSLDAVLVIGNGDTDATSVFKDLLDVHHYTRGLAFVPPGTPTNNTPAVDSGHSARLPDHKKSFDTEFGPPKSGPDSTLLATALGVNPVVFAHVANADLQVQSPAADMSTALWAATGGYFIQKMLVGAYVTYDENLVTDIRNHFIDFVCAQGPYPALRIGNQPYGILPAISLDRWAPLADDSARLDPFLVAQLRSLKPLWSASIGFAPKVTGKSVNADTDLLGALAMDAKSTSYAGRPVLGPGYFDYLFRYLTAGRMTGWWDQQKLLSQLPEGTITFTATPLVLRAAYANKPFLIGSPAVRQDPKSDPTSTLPMGDNYIAWLKDDPSKGGASGYAAIRDRGFFAHGGGQPHVAGDGKPTPLLYKILRHSALQEYWQAAYVLAGTRIADRIEPELVDLSPLQEDNMVTVWDLLAHPPSGATGGPSIGAILDQRRISVSGPDSFAAFWKSVDNLSRLSADRLEDYFAGSLDLCSFRLDAWITSLATERLGHLRGTGGVKGLFLGGYGWVENLSNALTRAASKGYVQAPSLDHAAAVAVMRSGYLAHVGASGGDPFAINLSSRRARMASWLLEGIRDQPLGALLGYRFERGLHEAGLDQYIDPMRRIAPLAAIKAAQSAWRDAEVASSAAALASADAWAATRTADETHAAAAIDAEQAKVDLLANEQHVEALQAQLAQTAAQQQAAAAQLAASTLQDAESIAKLEGLQVQETGLRAQAAAAALQKPLLVESLQKATAAVSAANAQATSAKERATTLDQQSAAGAINADEYRQRHEQLLRSTGGPGFQASGSVTADALQSALESVAANNVVDGLALDRLNKAKPPLIPWGSHGLPGSGDADYPKLLGQLAALDEAVDAVGDAVLAESVFQTVRGNSIRAAATVDVVARGEVPPPTLDALRTPRSGSSFQQRLLVILGSTVPTATGWPVTPRAQSEPRLNAWLAALFGDPARFCCRVEYLDQAGNRITPPGRVTINLGQVGLAPLDIAYLAEEPSKTTELEEWLAYQVMQSPLKPSQVPTDARVRLIFERDPGWQRSVVSIPELLDVARVARILIGGGRALGASDLATPQSAPNAGLNISELEARSSAAVSLLANVEAGLVPQHIGGNGDGLPHPPPGPIDVDALRSALVTSSQLGVRGAVPVSPLGNGPAQVQALVNQARRILTEVQQRSARLAQLPAPGSAPEEHVRYECARLAAIYGQEFVALPTFLPGNASDLQSSFSDSANLQGGDPTAAFTWVQRQSRIRSSTARLQTLLTYAEVLTDGRGFNYQVAQLPYRPQTYWSACAPAGQLPPAGSVGLVAHTPWAVDATQPLCGLVIDEVIEVVPSDTEVTGLTFQFDEPNTRAPQALLLAVPPTSNPWDSNTLAATVRETLELAKIRMVDPDALRSLGQLLPALHFAVNLAQSTVSTDLTGLDFDFGSAVFLFQSVPAQVEAGKPFNVSISFSNSGSQPWKPPDFQLGIQSPQGGSIWGVDRVPLPTSIVAVAPGETVTFSFAATAPVMPSSYDFQWQMIRGNEWFGDLTPAVAVAVIGPPPDTNAAYVSQTVPSTVKHDVAFDVIVTMKNTGSTTWSSSGPTPFRLGSQNPQNNRTWGENRVDVPGVIPPGGEAIFRFSLTAPATARKYNFQWQMLQEGVGWFGETSTNVGITVTGSNGG